MMNLDYKLVADILINFIKEETEKVGLKNLVIGLSGGIDSALSAVLALKAVGSERLFAYTLPYRSSSKESVEDAELLSKTFGINLQTIDITPYTEAFFNTVKVESRLRMGNIMARMRMVTLFDMSSKHQGIVIGTSNKTELLLGYGTWYGDLASAINPIGDLYKTQVWELSKYLCIPNRLIEKKPTADLWEGQTDENELGFSYKDVDRLLYFMVDERRSKDELIGIGFSSDFISKISDMVRKNQFKRRLPVIAKLSHRTIDKDFRYCRDWGY